MKSLYSVVAIVTAVTIIGMVAVSTQQASAFGFVERKEFKKLTTEFEKDVLSKVTEGQDPDTIYRLVDEYSNNVKALFASPSPSP